MAHRVGARQSRFQSCQRPVSRPSPTRPRGLALPRTQGRGGRRRFRKTPGSQSATSPTRDDPGCPCVSMANTLSVTTSVRHDVVPSRTRCRRKRDTAPRSSARSPLSSDPRVDLHPRWLAFQNHPHVTIGGDGHGGPDAHTRHPRPPSTSGTRRPRLGTLPRRPRSMRPFASTSRERWMRPLRSRSV
jgi:hypothetical protein